MKIEDYKKMQVDCNTLCDVTEELIVERDLMRCVTCPFCKETVDAILTETTIACPACEIIVEL